MTYCMICGMDKTRMKNNKCLSDMREQFPEMLTQMANAIKIIDPVHIFVEMPEPLPQIYGKGIPEPKTKKK